MTDPRPLIMHIVYSFRVGGLENGVANLINRLPASRYRHAVVALTDCSDEFCARVRRKDVEFVSLHKPPGHALRLYPALHRLFRDWRPDVVHTRNLAALEAAVPAWSAGVPVRIHGEHGWDMSDPDGTRRRFRFMRRLYRPFVTHYVALSGHLQRYLEDGVGVAPARITRLTNGVDTRSFHPVADGMREPLPGSPFNACGVRVIGTVGRLQAIKDQVNLVRAFALLRREVPSEAEGLRLMIVGDGPLRPAVEAEIARAGIADQVWLAGERGDVPAMLRGMDVFVLPSRAEGISNTVLEAMASGLPVVATAVGGNPELVVPGTTGALVPPDDSRALAAALAPYAVDEALARRHGLAARHIAENQYSIDGMVARYATLYDSLLSAAGRPLLAT